MADCAICMSPMGGVGPRRPKVLPCGHSYCLRCLESQNHKKCAVDRKPYHQSPKDLPDNFSILTMSENNNGRQQARRFWCLVCRREATGACLDHHQFCSLQQGRAELQQQRQGLRQAVERAADVLQDMKELVKDCLDAVRATSMGYWRCLVAARQSAHTLLARMADSPNRGQGLQGQQQEPLVDEAAGGGAASVWEEAEAIATNHDGEAWRAIQLMPVLTDPGSQCTLTVSAWGSLLMRCTVRVQDEPLAQLLLLHLERTGRLHQDDQPQQQQQQQQQLGDQQQQAQQQAQQVQQPGSDLVCLGSPQQEPPSLQQQLARRMKVPLLKGSSNRRFLTDLEAESTAARSPRPLSAEVTRLVCGVSGLHCGEHPAWSADVLRQLPGCLFSLELLSPAEEHLGAVDDMLGLRELSVFMPRADRDTLQRVLALPALRYLDVHTAADDVLMPAVTWEARGVSTPTLRHLRTGLRPLAVALDLAEAFGDSLLGLQIVASCRRPYGGDNAELARMAMNCALPVLRTLVLVRWTGEGEALQHSVDTCAAQRQTLWEAVVAKQRTISVLCSVCDQRDVQESYHQCL